MQLFSFRPWDFVTESVLKKQKFLLRYPCSLSLYVIVFMGFVGFGSDGWNRTTDLGVMKD